MTLTLGRTHPLGIELVDGDRLVGRWIGSSEEAEAVVRAVNERDDVLQLLADCEEYFDSRADAEYLPGDATPTGNEEMRILTVIRALQDKYR